MPVEVNKGCDTHNSSVSGKDNADGKLAKFSTLVREEVEANTEQDVEISSAVKNLMLSMMLLV